MKRVACLSGGVGGARFLHGLARALPPGAVTAIVNTGDDFVHWGLDVSPDLDTVMYTLADLAHVERGWGLAEESWTTLAAMRRLGAPDWFSLGDRDLATHLVRSEELRRGVSLSAITARLASALGVTSAIVPMSDHKVRTLIETREHGTIPFQDWFVRLRAAPAVVAVRFDANPPPAPAVLALLREAELVVIAPSNPYVSIDPILALPGVRDALVGRRCVAVSPIVAGAAVKGPLAEMIQGLAGAAPSAGAIAAHYGSLLGGIVVEHGDEASVRGPKALGAATVMRTRADSERLAREVLAFAAELPR